MTGVLKLIQMQLLIWDPGALLKALGVQKMGLRVTARVTQMQAERLPHRTCCWHRPAAPSQHMPMSSNFLSSSG